MFLKQNEKREKKNAEVKTPALSTVKSCIKPLADVQFFNFLVRLLFKCVFYLRAAYMQRPESAKPVRAVWHM